ncbi:HIRA-interacting protein 3 isoform X1 [Rhipicephalus sanguineus]|uniref:HIRA-interacting protein 3 isoform X1 n=1 Tax=Rhipicephalus sanguineus TaxID=34632 RepID=UPI0020C33319|nr:HIRA-interacting protein 3 isoform X1 [Rhipicephalus sanguineus]XP_049269434.1 HIRA-interacting protein 3 isoform X1 [Rhipicephalus sanguineus]
MTNYGWRELAMAAVSASSMLEFVRRIFRERQDHGMLTIRQLRTLYTDELKVKHLSSENREVFASIVTTVFKEFEEADCREKSLQDSKSSTDETPAEAGATSPLRTILPQNGNCYVDSESPIKCPNIKNVQRVVDSSSDSDDDDVIRAVKETLGVRTRRRTQPKPAPVPSVSLVAAVNSTSSIIGANASIAISSDSSHISPKVPSPSASPGTSSSLSSNPVPSVISDSSPKDSPRDESVNASSNAAASAVCCAIPTVVFPVVSGDKAEAPCGGDASDSSDSEGKLMIAESPMSAESPRRPSSDGEGSARVGEHAVVEPRRPPLPESKKTKTVANSPSEEPKTPTQESNGKEHKSMDDMPLFTLKLTKTKTGNWIMVKPKSEESDAGEEMSPQKPNVVRRKRVSTPRKTKAKIPESARGIFDSSDDEPLSELRNKQPMKKPAPAQAVVTENPSISELEQKLTRVHKRRKKPADGFPPPSKKRKCTRQEATGSSKKCTRRDATGSSKKPAAKPASAENPAVAKLKRCISAAGLRVRYVQLLEETDTVEQKEAKLMKVLRDAGLQGNPTLKSCRELRQRREEENEVRSLDKSNIVENSQDGATKRTTRSAAVSIVPSATPEKPEEAVDESCKVFSRLKDIIDSEDSE